MTRHILFSSLFASFFLASISGQTVAPSENETSSGVPFQEYLIDEDPLRRFFVLGEGVHSIQHPVAEKGEKPKKPTVKAPKDGYRLLVVLPGGSGTADFKDFVGRIWQNALSEKYLVAELVAPVYSEEQAKKLVWPTQNSPHPGMKFSCEEFVDDVITDVRDRYKIDSRYIFLFGWSSSGPTCYSYAFSKDRQATGSFISMSVFLPSNLPSSKYAKGHAFYLMHSPEDWISIEQPREAVEALEKRKAKVTLTEVPGGHGWTGNVYGNMQDGITWLETNAEKPKKPRRKSR